MNVSNMLRQFTLLIIIGAILLIHVLSYINSELSLKHQLLNSSSTKRNDDADFYHQVSWAEEEQEQTFVGLYG